MKEQKQTMEKMPTDLKTALETAGLSEFFAGCTAAHQREYLRWIDEAKRKETRADRIRKTMTMLSEKRVEENVRAGKNLKRSLKNSVRCS